jgi:nucleoside-diphosphate-sugar epimerase
MNKNILITGGSGFLGENIIKALKKEYKKITIYNLSSSRSKDKSVINIIKNVKKIKNLDNIKVNFDYIIHTLALSHNNYCLDLADTDIINVHFTKNILEFAKKQKSLKKFIYISSILVYDQNNAIPVKEDARLNIFNNNYSFTKGIAEMYVQYYQLKENLPITIFRPSNIYGPGQKYIDSPFLIPSKIYQGITEKKISVLDASPKRDWLYIEDFTDAVIKSLKSKNNGTFNVAGEKQMSVEEIASIISKKLKVPVTYQSKSLNTKKTFSCNINKIKKILSWKPKTEIEIGIEKTIKDIKNKI